MSGFLRKDREGRAMPQEQETQHNPPGTAAGWCDARESPHALVQSLGSMESWVNSILHNGLFMRNVLLENGNVKVMGALRLKTQHYWCQQTLAPDVQGTSLQAESKSVFPFSLSTYICGLKHSLLILLWVLFWGIHTTSLSQVLYKSPPIYPGMPWHLLSRDLGGLLGDGLTVIH